MISSQFSLFDTLVQVEPDIIRDYNDSFAIEWCGADVWALDIETYGVSSKSEALNPFAGEIRLIQVALPNGKLAVFDLRDSAFSLDIIGQLRSKLSDDSIVVIHNAAFELQWLAKKFGCVGNKVFDTMIASQIVYAGIEPYRHNLKACVKRELSIELNKDEQISDFGLPQLSSSQINYCANDVRHLIRLAVVLINKAVLMGLKDTIEIEMGALLPYAKMGLDGFPVCIETLNTVLEEYQQALEEVRSPVLSVLNVSSVSNSVELKQALSKHLGVTISSTNKTELSQYSDDCVISCLLDARTLENFVGYIQRCKDAVIDGAVRGSFRQCAPKGLGRATCGSDTESLKSGFDGIPSVNLHNPPNPSKASPSIKALGLPPVRSFFKPQKGDSLLVFDFSAAHARVAAQTTQDKAFIASYVDNVDCHAIVASKLSSLVDKKWSREDISRIRKEKTDDGSLATRLRNIAKNVFYGWLNGAGKKKTLDTIHAGGLSNATIETASEIIDLLGESFPGIKSFHDRTKRELKKTNPMPDCKLEYASIRAISGRRVYAPCYPPKYEGDSGGCNPNEAYIANWMMVESDSKKRAMALIWKKSKLRPEWRMRLANECHDEIDVLCDTRYVDAVARFCWKAMNGSLAYWVTDLPAYEDEYSLEACLAESWASK